MSFINIEIKAGCENTELVEQVLLQNQAKYIGQDHQVDTYFKVPTGRLKLREGKIENALIFYQRPNQVGPKKSDITLYKTENREDLKAVLLEVHEVLVIVDKQRKIYFVDNIKFHLDEVKGLGSFVEIEAIDEHHQLGEAQLRQQVNYFMELFGIREEDLLDVSYSDLLLSRQP